MARRTAGIVPLTAAYRRLPAQDQATRQATPRAYRQAYLRAIPPASQAYPLSSPPACPAPRTDCRLQQPARRLNAMRSTRRRITVELRRHSRPAALACDPLKFACVRKSRSVELPPYLLLPVSPRGRVERQVPSRIGGETLAPLTPCPIVGEHSCAPLQGMSMLDPDFAALRYFFHYRFPHVRERAFASALHASFESDSVPRISGFSGSSRRLVAMSTARRPFRHADTHEGFRSATNMARLRAVSGLLLQQQAGLRRAASDVPIVVMEIIECASREARHDKCSARQPDQRGHAPRHAIASI